MLHTTVKIPIHTVASVTNASTLILPANSRRFYATFVNQSNVPIWIRFVGPAVVDDGIFIAANGFSYEMTRENLWQGDVYAIHGSAGIKLMQIVEGT